MAVLKFFIAILLLSLINKGLCACKVNDKIQISTVRTGKEVSGKPEWGVKVINNCNCAQKNIFLRCKGFQSVENVDPSLFLPSADGRCLVKNGEPVAPFDNVSFNYAGDPFFFLPLSSVDMCS
ncbi:uncharacterized protein At1g05835-like [Cornus florida]|uniref:uncharacterized protein At1g05835-like n=1 Tax=Cornus florida TaxID=4283 RepID=UPI00289EC771|nr:uncharacterized protein At1g05835-like [Cornus florida]